MTATATQPTGYAPALLFRVLTRAQYFGRDANLPALVREKDAVAQALQATGRDRGLVERLVFQTQRGGKGSVLIASRRGGDDVFVVWEASERAREIAAQAEAVSV